MYKVAKFLKDEKLSTKFMFFHLRESGEEKVVNSIQTITKKSLGWVTKVGLQKQVGNEKGSGAVDQNNSC